MMNVKMMMSAAAMKPSGIAVRKSTNPAGVPSTA